VARPQHRIPRPQHQGGVAASDLRAVNRALTARCDKLWTALKLISASVRSGSVPQHVLDVVDAALEEER